MRFKLVLAGLAVAACLLGARLSARADDTKKNAGFGPLETTPAATAKAKSLAWLKKATNDNANLQAFEAIWNRPDRSILDNVADTFALGDPKAAAVLKDARETVKPATEVPAMLQDTKADAFFRANLGLAVARNLCNRRAHEEALAILATITPEQTVDPAAYLFHRAVAEHALLKKDDATQTITRLIHDAIDSPERYKTVSALMLLDMQTWKKDLANVARLMDNSGRRLELDRTDDQTKKIQRDVIARLDELIKELENKAKKQQQGGGGGGGGGGGDDGSACPDGSQPGGSGSGQKSGKQPPKSPADQFIIGQQSGPGNVNFTEIKKKLDNWATLPPSEQAQARQQIEELLSGLSPQHREAFENYFQEIQNRPLKNQK
jgi:hypothetical protein